MRRPTRPSGSGTTTASTMTLRGLVATAGMGTTLLAALAAPVVTLVLAAGVLAVVVGLRFVGTRRRGRPPVGADSQDRGLHRSLSDAITRP